MTRAPRLPRKATIALAVVALALTVLIPAGTAFGAPAAGTALAKFRHQVATAKLPAPPAPPKVPSAPPTVHPATTLSAPHAAPAAPNTTALNVANAAPGANPNQHTLVLYDTTGSWGWLGEAYAVEAANLVSHGSAYVMHPVASYQAGEMAGYTGVIYIGSTYNEPIPTAFLDDVLAGSRPVMWMNDNIWQLTALATNFTGQYGWNWTQFDFSTTPTVTYKSVALQRDPLAAPAGLLNTVVSDPTKATVLATATRTDGTTEPWAIGSGNLTYIGEIPFSYVGPTDRYFAAADLIGHLANPAVQNRKRALVRLEDVSPNDDPNQLKQVIDYLYGAGVPFSINVIPQYLDPKGYYNNGVPVSISLAQAPNFVSVLRYALSHGGTLNMEGYTHQYSNIANPYSGVSGDDFEFYLSHIDSSNNVVYDGPVPPDSATWALSRLTSGKLLFTQVGLPVPTVFTPPHYAGSAVDYTVFTANFADRFDRGLYFSGWCPGGACGTGTPDYTKLYGQYFPYLVRDIYGACVVPEDLGDVETQAYNNHPPRFPADILASAKGVSVITDGVQSFFYDPTLGTSYLQQIVTGLKGMGYQFVSTSTVANG